MEVSESHTKLVSPAPQGQRWRRCVWKVHPLHLVQEDQGGPGLDGEPTLCIPGNSAGQARAPWSPGSGKCPWPHASVVPLTLFSPT